MSISKDPGLRELEDYLDKERDKQQYDPNQDEEERRKLRVQYRNLTEKTLQNRKDLTAQDSGNRLYQYLDKANVLYEAVKNTQEAVLDAKFLTVSADINAQKAKNINIGVESEINLDDLVGKVITASKDGIHHVDDECLDWEYLGKKASLFSKKAQTMDFLLGPLYVERKQVKRAKTSRIVRNKEDLVTPTQLQKEDIRKQENETSNNVNNIYKILSEVEPINYFKFITNPESFSQTVENIFYVSFLARTGVVSIDVSSGQPILSLKSVPSVENLEDVVPKKQIIVGIDLKDFHDIIKTYNVTTSCIPTREVKEQVASSRTWY
ncbi:MAG: Nse4 C-terminal-domain-containing protein [Benjaminiella poitrasii]|nr:MAG: Nse4 C-terminal-domain-containing protein [Benjaminiella poitrasii]